MIEGVSVIVRRVNRFLLVERGREPLKGMLAFPGGRIEHGETREQAALRELVEETSLEAMSVSSVESFTLRTEAGEYRLHVFEAVAQGDAVAGDDAAALLWLSAEEIEKRAELVAADTLRLVRRLNANR